ncbi:hypothetical protein F5887DRAFT_920317 [Amanita rubescens]|nr:hypothetical protein F5887DRAFT_920317 [Amanita rubescens]
MLLDESRNSRHGFPLGVSRNSYNNKDPPECGSRRDPGSRETPLSFSTYLEHFYPKALTDYLRERETLKRELSIFHTSHPRIMEMAQLEPNAEEQCHSMQAQHTQLVAYYEGEMSSLKRELYARYKREYKDFHCKLLLEKAKREAERAHRPSTLSVVSTTLSPSRTSDCSSPSPRQFTPHKEIGPHVTSVDSQSVSAPETRNSPGRVRVARPKASPSSNELDSPSAHQSTIRKPLQAPKLMTTRFDKPESTLETVSTFLKPACDISVHAKPLEQSDTAVLTREPPKGSSLTGDMPSSRVISAPSKRVDACTPGKCPTRKVEVSIQKRTSASRHSPFPNAALTPRNSMAILSIRPPLTRSSKDGSEPSSQVTLKTSPSNIVNAGRIVSETAHQNTETRARVSLTVTAAAPWFDKQPSVAGGLERLIERSIIDTERTEQAPMPSSSEVEERRPVPYAVVSEIMEKKQETCSPDNSATLSLHDNLVPISRPQPRPGVHVKLLERVNTVVLSREPPMGSSLMGITPSTQVVSVPSSKRRSAHVPRKPPDRKVECFFFQRRGFSAFTGEFNAVKTACRKTGNSPRVPGVTSRPLFGETTSPHLAVSGQRMASIFSEEPSADKIECSNEHSNVIVGLAVGQALAPLSTEVEERRWDPDATVSIQNGGEEDTHSHLPNAALTLRKSTSVSSLRAPASPTRRNAHAPDKLLVTKEDSSVKGTSAVKHSPADNAPLFPCNPVPTPPAWASSACLSKDGIMPSSQAISTRYTSNVKVSMRRAVNKTAHHKIPETHPRVSHEPSSPQLGGPPPVGIRGHSDECSKVAVGPADERALISSLSEVEERRRVSDAIVSKTKRTNEETRSPKAWAAPSLPTSTSVPSSILPTSTIGSSQPLGDPIPPAKVISRRHNLNVVNKTSEVHNLHSPSLETARKRSKSCDNPFSIEGEGQLARAAAYVQERLKRRSSTFDEFPRRSPKVPPDESLVVEFQPRRLEICKEATRASWNPYGYS